jgi:hypothetical protein
LVESCPLAGGLYGIPPRSFMGSLKQMEKAEEIRVQVPEANAFDFGPRIFECNSYA